MIFFPLFFFPLPFSLAHINSAPLLPVAVSQPSVTSALSLLWYASLLLIKFHSHAVACCHGLVCLVVATAGLPTEFLETALKDSFGKMWDVKVSFFFWLRMLRSEICLFTFKDKSRFASETTVGRHCTSNSVSEFCLFARMRTCRLFYAVLFSHIPQPWFIRCRCSGRTKWKCCIRTI